MPPRHQRRTCLDWGCSRHAKLPQVPQISAGLALPTEELLSPHQPHWNCQRVRLSNDSIEQNPFDTLPCKSGNKASLASPTGWILALTARRGANGTFRQDRGFGTLLGSITSWQSTPDLPGNRKLGYRDALRRLRYHCWRERVSGKAGSIGSCARNRGDLR
jgi:hypothetical protein